jgi:hypothetical protein
LIKNRVRNPGRSWHYGTVSIEGKEFSRIQERRRV